MDPSLQTIGGAWTVHVLVAGLVTWMFVRILNSKLLGAILGFALGTAFIALMWAVGARPFHEYFLTYWDPFDPRYRDPDERVWLWHASVVLVSGGVALLSPRKKPEDADRIRRVGDDFQELATSRFHRWRVDSTLGVGIAALLVHGHLQTSRWSSDWWDLWKMDVSIFVIALAAVGVVIPFALAFRFLKESPQPIGIARLLDEWSRRALKVNWPWMVAVPILMAGVTLRSWYYSCAAVVIYLIGMALQDL